MKKKSFLRLVMVICVIALITPFVSIKSNAVTAPQCPSITSITSQNNMITINWGYTNNPDGTGIEILDTTNGVTYNTVEAKHTYTIFDLTAGQSVTIIIRAVHPRTDIYVCSDWSAAKTIVVNSGSGSTPQNDNTKTVPLNSWTAMQNKESDAVSLRYSFTLDEPGWVKPEMRIDDERSHGNIYAYVKNRSLTKSYSTEEDWYYWQDSSGHNWRVHKYTKTRLPSGTYYFDIPSDALDIEYGYFKFIIRYGDESGRSNVETEFNNSRSKADKVSFNKTYYGNIGPENDVDYYKIKLTKKKTVCVTMYYPDTNNYTGGDYCTIRNKNGSRLAGDEFIDTVEDSNGKVWYKARVKKKLKKGTYYIKMENLDKTDDYKFKVTRK